METKKVKEQKKHVPKSSIAGKYNCSRAYVDRVLQNGGKSILAKKILQDAEDIINVIERETIITL